MSCQCHTLVQPHENQQLLLRVLRLFSDFHSFVFCSLQAMFHLQTIFCLKFLTGQKPASECARLLDDCMLHRSPNHLTVHKSLKKDQEAQANLELDVQASLKARRTTPLSQDSSGQ